MFIVFAKKLLLFLKESYTFWKLSVACVKMIAANFVIPSLFAKELLTCSQIIPGSIQINFVNFDKLYKAWQNSSNFVTFNNLCQTWQTLSSSIDFITFDKLLSSSTNFAKLYKAQSGSSTLLNCCETWLRFLQLGPARLKFWSLQAIKSISLWSLHGGPLQLDLIFGVLGRPSFQDVVSSRHRAG